MYRQQPIRSNPVAVQPKGNTDLSPAQNTTLELLEKTEEVGNETLKIKHLSESGDNSDQDSNSANEGTVQRACSECEAEQEQKKDTGIIQAKEEQAGSYKNLFKPLLLNTQTHNLQARTIEEQNSKASFYILL
jgi:hypothetical protein